MVRVVGGQLTVVAGRVQSVAGRDIQHIFFARSIRQRKHRCQETPIDVWQTFGGGWRLLLLWQYANSNSNLNSVKETHASGLLVE